jgi:hypothetical protein
LIGLTGLGRSWLRGLGKGGDGEDGRSQQGNGGERRQGSNSQEEFPRWLGWCYRWTEFYRIRRPISTDALQKYRAATAVTAKIHKIELAFARRIKLVSLYRITGCGFPHNSAAFVLGSKIVRAAEADSPQSDQTVLAGIFSALDG